MNTNNPCVGTYDVKLDEQNRFPLPKDLLEIYQRGVTCEDRFPYFYYRAHEGIVSFHEDIDGDFESHYITSFDKQSRLLVAKKSHQPKNKEMYD